MDKKEFRKIASEKRNSIPSTERDFCSEKIFKTLVQLPLYQKANRIFLYLSFRSEVDTYAILKHSLQQKKEVYAPITLTETKELLCCRVTNPNTDFQKDVYGIDTPIYSSDKIISPKKIDLVLVPGLAFDKKKYRMGYGGGFYDRFLPKLSPNAITVGLAFSAQIYPSIPIEEYDSKLNYILTEASIY